MKKLCVSAKIIRDMKRLVKLSLIILIPLISGFALVVAGGALGNEDIIRIGELILLYGMPITMFLLVVIGLVLMITGKLSDSKKSDDQSNAQSDAQLDDNTETLAQRQQSKTKEDEISELRGVNSSRGYESRRKSDEYMMRHVANNYKHATPKEKVLGWLFFGFLMTDFALIFVFGVIHNIAGVIVCLSLFAGTIFISLIVKIILEKTSMRVNSKKLDGKEAFKGTVTACLLSSTTSVGGPKRRHTTRITGVVYRIVIERDGQQYTAYTDNYYEEGEEVFFVILRNSLVTIVDADKVKVRDDTKF